MTPVDKDADALKILRARAAISKLVDLERGERDEREGFSIPWHLMGIAGIAAAACFGLYLAGSMLASAIRSLPF